jgi:HPt (histidine-containing phosphotransfer) domain-containing protein
LAARDGEALFAVAHSVKGACEALAAAPMAGLCAELERAARDRSFDTAARLIPLAAGELEQLLRMADRLAAESPS